MGLPKRLAPPFLSVGSDEEGRRQKNASSCDWNPKAVGILLDSYAQKFSVGRGYLRSKDWEEVVHNVNTRSEGLKFLKTMKQCRDKVDSLKRRYKMEKRKAVNGNAVTWPFFNQLDKMMGSMLKQGKGLEPSDRHQKTCLIEYNHVDREDEKLDCSGSPEECYDVHCKEFIENGKLVTEKGAGSWDDGLNPQQPIKLLRLTAAQESTDNSSERCKLPQLQGKVHAKMRKRKPDNNPIQALADAVVGFSEVFARIELAKMEVYTKMKLEMAKLQRKRRRRGCRKQEPSNSSSTSSD